ncbi:hypothetical protein B0T24DRAFT_673243 [Lasiosphaeria ovina]|uniref:DUF726-domain-containing protein n=1 Tax=Lasiosphaeria ovina TaxID=92902 RepID=A0AAE0TXN0_9PEZI|nr:hypothetical protein B0T24DRAFT_673243 [Lasiosphaeria ovina]
MPGPEVSSAGSGDSGDSGDSGRGSGAADVDVDADAGGTSTAAPAAPTAPAPEPEPEPEPEPASATAAAPPPPPSATKYGDPPIPNMPENPTPDTAPAASNMAVEPPEPPELDDFGLPVRKYNHAERSKGKTKEKPTQKRPKSPTSPKAPVEAEAAQDAAVDAHTTSHGSSQALKAAKDKEKDKSKAKDVVPETGDGTESGSDEHFSDAVSRSESVEDLNGPRTPMPHARKASTSTNIATPSTKPPVEPSQDNEQPLGAESEDTKPQTKHGTEISAPASSTEKPVEEKPANQPDQAISESKKDQTGPSGRSRNRSDLSTGGAPSGVGLGVGISEFSHQQLTTHKPEDGEGKDGDEWQTMPAYAPYDLYNDDNKLIAKEYDEAEVKDETYGYAGLGGAGKGYTRVLLDDDAESATSMDENTQYLFKDQGGTTSIAAEDEESQRDAVSQLQATKDLLTEGQRIAYVGLTRLELSAMLTEAETLKHSSRTKKQLAIAAESMKMWSQKMMIRLYTHMDISPAEQIMIEQLSSHGVLPADLTSLLMANARVKNPMAADQDKKSPSLSGHSSPRPASMVTPEVEQAAEPPPPYSANPDSELTEPVRTPSQMPTTQKIDIDLRWTVLCDLFLVLIADSVYDARSRVLLERVGKDLEIPWIDICRFEKKVTDALEMQQNAEKENWNEDEHMETRRKLALKRRYVMMGLATVGGGLVIGLSAGLLAPVIGAGLAAGFTTIGVTGTTGFLAGAGGAAVITSGAAASGGIIGGRAAGRRTGAVKTFEYRPLHNNKRVNLIVTVSGWMTGKIDDVRLPFSTVDPVMGDIYSVLWEPEMLTSMGDTINILATEALTQGLQQLLGSTVLVSLMAALQLPVVLTKLSYLIDNPWAVSLDRATMAGLILADSIIDRNLGTRPITLVGYSLGSRVIFSCLQELAKKGAYGLVQNVFLFGSPTVVKHDEYMRARAVVSGRFVNGYNRNDWILGYLFRLTNGGIRRVAGLAAIDDIPDLENMDVSEFVVGHMDYRTAMPRLLRESGWLVESDEFAEIEPDPEDHKERQRELINEIEEARKELEKEGKRGKTSFSFWKKKKALQKQEWELYEESNKSGANPNANPRTEDLEGRNHGVLFDVDAIRAELAKEQQEHGKDGNLEEEMLQVREIKSTLPPMKLDLSPKPDPPPPTRSPRSSIRETRSAEVVPPLRSSTEYKPQSHHERQPSSSRLANEQRLSLERTPTFPAAKPGSDYYHQFGSGFGSASSSNNGMALHGDYTHDEEVQMTFDTAFDDSGHDKASSSSVPSAVPAPLYTLPDDDAKSSFSTSAALRGYGHNRQFSTSKSAAGTARPEIKSAQTVPNITLADPWADEDEDFGKEKEISMTFA